MLGTKWPSMISICSQLAPLRIVSEHAAPKAAKSAERMDGAIMAGGDIVEGRDVKRHVNSLEPEVMSDCKCCQIRSIAECFDHCDSLLSNYRFRSDVIGSKNRFEGSTPLRRRGNPPLLCS